MRGKVFNHKIIKQESEGECLDSRKERHQRGQGWPNSIGNLSGLAATALISRSASKAAGDLRKGGGGCLVRS